MPSDLPSLLPSIFVH